MTDSTERSHVGLNPQQKRLVEYLESKPGRYVSNRDAIFIGIQSLSRRITELQELGFEITKQWKRDHFGHRYMVYSLKQGEEVG
jgi:hypothetical protein